MSIVSHDQVLRVHAAAVTLGLASNRVALLAGIAQSWVAGLPGAENAGAQLLADLGRLNDLERRPDGTVPLQTWLENALALCGSHSEAGVFREVLALVKRPGAAATPPATNPTPSGPPATSGPTYNITIERATIASLAVGDGASTTGTMSIGSDFPSAGSPAGAWTSASTPRSASDWDVSQRTRVRVTELLKDAQAHLDARRNHTWNSTLRGTNIPVWLIQGADRILRQDEGLSVPGYYETPGEVCDALHGESFLSYLAACSKYLVQVQQIGTPYRYMLPAEFERRVNTILADDGGFACRAILRGGGWLSSSHSKKTSSRSALQSVYLSYDPADEAFVERLFQALDAQGVATFYFSEHAPAGQRLGRVARVGVNQHDRVLLFCSKAGLTSPRVLNELEETLEREAREGGSARLIPIMLDGFVSSGWSPPNADVVHAVTGRVMVDLIGADRDAAKLEKGLRRLVAALKG